MPEEIETVHRLKHKYMVTIGMKFGMPVAIRTFMEFTDLERRMLAPELDVGNGLIKIDGLDDSDVASPHYIKRDEYIWFIVQDYTTRMVSPVAAVPGLNLQ